MTAEREIDWGSLGGNEPKTKPPKSSTAKKASKYAPVIDWGDIGKEPEAKENPISAWFKKDFLDKLKAQKGESGLETAGNLANFLINRPIERLGLPSAARGMWQGGENLIRGVGNLPAELLPPKGKEVPAINFPGTQQQIYPIPETTMPGPQGVNPRVQEGAEIAGNLAGSLPIGKAYQGIKAGLEHVPYTKIPELIKSLIAGGATGAALAPEHRALGAGLGLGAEAVGAGIGKIKDIAANRNPGARGREYLESQLDLERQKSSEESAKNQAKEEFGKNTPEALNISANKLEREVGQNEAHQNAYNAEHKMLPGEQHVVEAEHRAGNVNQGIKQLLGEGEPHSLQLSEHVTNAIEGIPTLEPHPKTGYPMEVRKGGLREQIGSQYDKLEQGLPEVEIPDVSKNKEIEKKVNEHLNKFMSNKATSPEEREKLKASMIEAYGNQAGKKTIDGKSFFRAYRALRQEEGNLRFKSNKHGVGIKEGDELKGEANDVKHTYEDMEKIIEQHFPKDTIKELHRINHEYSTQVAPLNKNKVYANMRETGQVPGDILEKIAGKGKGNAILRNMIASNPELSRLALGHSYAEKPTELMKPNKLIEPYIQANPQVAELLGLQKQAHENLATAKNNELMVSQFKNLPELRVKYNRQRAMAKRLRDEAEVTGLSKNESLKKRLAYEEAQEKLNKLIKRTLGGSVGAGVVGYAVHKLMQ